MNSGFHTQKNLDIKYEFVIAFVQMNPNIWPSFTKSILKFQASTINSFLEICGKKVFGSQRLIGTKMNPTIGHTSSSKECDYMSSIAKNIDCSPLISD